ncbi:phycobilisome rod-core linker polypeptide [Synechococcus sp. M16CYN]|uniref:phycobilisome rod-core linker polypeptide n=1 Tax=Synechococcus sp. M16CYN TaxID=3103139 RepID=UPI003252D50D
MTSAKRLSTQANKDLDHAKEIIQNIYKQVFGNRHMMELDINTSLEALFMNGDLTVQGFVSALAQSETYKKLFLEPNNSYRFVELNCKHLLGRAPHDQQEIMAHVRLMHRDGYEAEIVSYTYSKEYLNVFGVDQVPYNRSRQTNVGGRTIGFSRARAFDAGYAGFDGAEKDSKLLNSLSTGLSPSIIDRKGIGNSNALSIRWVSNRQVGANRRSIQKSVIAQTSMSRTIQSILSQGGRVLSISKI